MHQTFTLTFGDQAENHVGMEKLGQPVSNGFSLVDLYSFKSAFDLKGFPTELYHLNKMFDDEKIRDSTTPAYLLVVREGLRAFVDDDVDLTAFFEEQDRLTKDTKAKMYGRVVNKHARHNLCFADVAHPPDYENGKGTVVAFEQVPLLASVRQSIEDMTGLRLVAEGNYYFNVNKCGIGYHGDSERRVVVGIRVGAEMPLHYRWYLNGKVASPTLKLTLRHGDVYVMSDKAVGWDWRMRLGHTLRHAAGCAKFLDEENAI